MDFRPGLGRYISPVRLIIAEVMVKRGKWSTCADDPQIDRDALCFTKEFFRRFHQQPPQARALARRIYGEQADIPAIAPKLDINAASESGGVFRDQEIPFCKKRSHALGTCAVTIENGALNHKGGID